MILIIEEEIKKYKMNPKKTTKIHWKEEFFLCQDMVDQDNKQGRKKI